MPEPMKFQILIYQSREQQTENQYTWEQGWDIRDKDDTRLADLAKYYRNNPKEYRNVRLFEAVEITEVSK